MKPLGELIAGWKPGKRGPTAGDAGVIAAAWADMVGAEIAVRTRPAQLRDGTITVLTLSSAWSQQLSFVAPTIVERLQARFPEASVRKLRFLVATGRSRALLRPPKAGMKKSPALRPARAAAERVAAADSAESLDSLLSRLRRSQAALDEARRAAGYTQCTRCRSWYPPPRSESGECAVCAEERRRRSDARVERELAAAPWLRRLELDSSGAVDARQFERVRRKLLIKWEAQLQAAQARLRRGQLEAGDRVTAWSYVMLLARVPKPEIGRAVVEDVVGAKWADELLPRKAPRPHAPK